MPLRPAAPDISTKRHDFFFEQIKSVVYRVCEFYPEPERSLSYQAAASDASSAASSRTRTRRTIDGRAVP